MIITNHSFRSKQKKSPILSNSLPTFFDFSLEIHHCFASSLHESSSRDAIEDLLSKILRKNCLNRDCCNMELHMAFAKFFWSKHFWAELHLPYTFYIIIEYLFMPLELQKHQNQELLHHKVRFRIFWFLKSTCGLGRALNIE